MPAYMVAVVANPSPSAQTKWCMRALLLFATFPRGLQLSCMFALEWHESLFLRAWAQIPCTPLPLLLNPMS